jgi:hypothetical protein
MKGLCMIATESKSVWQHLRQEDGGYAVIHTKDGDRFTLPINDVINACKSREKINEFCKEVATLLDRLAEWLAGRQSEIAEAYLGVEPEGAIFVVVQNAKAFDPDFEDALSLLDLDVAQCEDFNLIKLQVFALPHSSKETVATFLELDKAFRYAVDREDTKA